VRRSAPEVAGHLGRAGLAAFDALGRTWGVVERSLEQGRADDEGRREAGKDPAAAEPPAPSPAPAPAPDGAPEAADGQAGAGERG
jgi:hypothetical protein